MFQFHQNNSQLLFHVIVSPWGAGAFSRGFTKTLARQGRAFSRALKIEKLKAPLFPGPGGAGDANDWRMLILQLTCYISVNGSFWFLVENLANSCPMETSCANIEPSHEKTNNLHMRNQRRRSASQ